MSPDEIVDVVRRIPVGPASRLWLMHAAIVDHNWLALTVVYAHRWRQQHTKLFELADGSRLFNRRRKR